MNWRLVAIPVTLVPILAIAVQFDIGIDDIFAVGLWPFLGAVGLVMAKITLQGIKFAYIARTYIGKSFDSIKMLTGVRMGSEFIKFTTPMFIGAEFVVIYYLHKKKVKTSQAMWVAILDIVTEVFAAGILSVIAGIVALVNGAYVMGVVVLGTSIPLTGLWLALFFLSSKRTFQTPRVIAQLLIKIFKKKGTEVVDQANNWMSEVCDHEPKQSAYTKSKKNIRSITFCINGFLDFIWHLVYDNKKKSASHNPVNGMLVPSTTTPITYAPFTRATIPAITDSIPAANTSVTISKIATHMACEVFTFFLCR